MLPKSIEELAEWYMRYVSPLSLVAGFILDTLFLAKRVDLFITNALLFTYLIVSAVAICLINVIQSGRLRQKFAIQALPILPVVAQFAFGGLFSAYLSLYSRSADVAVSWIFVLALAGLILLNERFAHFYSRFFVQVPIYFTVLFSFLIFFLPVIFHAIGPFMFLVSGGLSLALIAAFWWVLAKMVPDVVKANRERVVKTIAMIFVIFNVLYFTNAIPPLPLSLKNAGVYHSVMPLSDGSYRLSGEILPWYEKFLNYARVYHRVPGEPVFVWTEIFAPSGLSTIVFHKWQRFDENAGTWVTESEISFPIYGGRDGGFRGYTEKISVAPGRWRVDVVTRYGQLIGRVKFTVEDVNQSPQLVVFSK